MRRILLTSGIIFLLTSCKSSDLSNQKDFHIQNDSINLYAFIGEKISVTEFNPNENNEQEEIDSVTGEKLITKTYIMDSGFNVKYKVIKNVFNELKTDTVEFVAYDHYGRPGFENYQNAILYLSWNGKEKHYYHQKYIFDPVKMNSKGVWKGLKGETVNQLFEKQQNGVLKARGIME